MTLRILTVVGARPQFIKAAVLSRVIANRRAEGQVTILEDIVHTGQHFDANMSKVFFNELAIPAPVVHLGIRGGQHGRSTGAMLAALEAEMLSRSPDLVLVYGDTNSTLAGALAAAKLHIPVAHVEAGLRSFNKKMPEEINRVLTDYVSDLLFCPSEVSRANLKAERITKGVHIVGDVMYDAILFYRNRADTPQFEQPYAVATIHRAENTESEGQLRGIFKGFATCSIPIIMPLHPRTRQVIQRYRIEVPANVRIIDPCSYLQMIGLVDNSQFVFTDSGGLQKEAYFLGKRCITLRNETEWTELLDIGVNRLVGTDPKRIRDSIDWAFEPMTVCKPLYGDGRSGERIVDIIATWFSTIDH